MSAVRQSVVGLVEIGGSNSLAVTICSRPGLAPTAWVEFEPYDFDVHSAGTLRAMGALLDAAAAELDVGGVL